MEFRIPIIYIIFCAICANLAFGFVKKNRSSGTTCGTPVVADTRIVNGNQSYEGRWPWQVYFRALTSTTLTLSSYCGGSLIGDRWVVTAAHCSSGRRADLIHIVLGEFNRAVIESHDKEYAVAQVFNHPGWNRKTMLNDISLLKLAGSVTYTDYIMPICLPIHGTNVENGTTCWISGWGQTGSTDESSLILREASVPILDNSVCDSIYSLQFQNEHICAGFTGNETSSACFGDSGGPLSCQDSISGQYVLQGVTSFGPSVCGGYPSGFARVSEYVDWIESTMESNQGSDSFFEQEFTACGSTIIDTQVIRLPVDQETQLYSANMTCTFTIVPPSNESSSSTYTKLSFLERFVVEPEANCGYDYLQITTSSSIYQGSSVSGLSLRRNSSQKGRWQDPLTLMFILTHMAYN